jgi:hypothetical protein
MEKTPQYLPEHAKDEHGKSKKEIPTGTRLFIISAFPQVCLNMN